MKRRTSLREADEDQIAWPSLLFPLFGAGLAFFACSSQSPGPGSTGTDGSGGRRCQDIYIVGDPCDPCLHKKCCTPILACDSVCLDCLRGGLPCNEAANEMYKCIDDLCAKECAPTWTGGAGGSTTSSGTGGGGGAGK